MNWDLLPRAVGSGVLGSGSQAEEIRETKPPGAQDSDAQQVATARTAAIDVQAVSHIRLRSSEKERREIND
jgi:hypothetical protein